MTVQQLIEELRKMPGHVPVTTCMGVEVLDCKFEANHAELDIGDDDDDDDDQ